MIITSQINDKLAILAITGNITKRNVKDLKDYAEPLLQDTELKGLIIDMQGIQLIDSQGLAFLLTCVDALEKRGLFLSLCHVSLKIKFILELAQFDKLIHIFDKQTDALHALT